MSRVPGLQYPPAPTEIEHNIFDNLFYLRREVETIPAASSILTKQQIQQLVSQTINNTVVNPTTASCIIGTHAIRLTTAPTLGAEFFETDRSVLYVGSDASGALSWVYSTGVYYATFANRPTDLGVNDANFLYVPDIHLHWCRWNGTAWVILDDDGGTIVESVRTLGVGYQVLDGTATSYLAVSAGSLVQAAFNTPDEVTAPSGVYHKSIAAYTGTINAASSGAFSGTPAAPTGTVSAPVFTGSPGTTSGPNTSTTATSGTTGVADEVHTHAFTPAGTNSAPTLTMNNYTPAGTVATTGEPRNVGVQRYVRR